MEKEFDYKYEYSYDKKQYYKAFYGNKTLVHILLTAFKAVLLIFMLYQLILTLQYGVSFFTWYYALLSLFVVYTMLRRVIHIERTFNRMKTMQGVDIWRITIGLGENIETDIGNISANYQYDQIKKAELHKDFAILYLAKNASIELPNKHLIYGDLKALPAFLKEKNEDIVFSYSSDVPNKQ